jgi:hypothetical protein
MISISFKDHEKLIEQLRDYDSLRLKFYQSGGLEIEILRQFKSSFAKAYLRAKKSYNLQRESGRNIFCRYYYYLWVFWDSVVLGAFEPRDKGYIAAVYFLRMFGRDIEKFGGEDIGDNSMRITFYPRA